MKKFIFLLMTVLFLTSCSINQEKEVQKIAQTYLDAVGNYHFDEARNFVTDSSFAMISMMENFLKQVPKEEIVKNLPVTTTISNVSVSNDTATVSFTTKSPLYQHEGMIKLIKTNRKWQIDLPLSFPHQ